MLLIRRLSVKLLRLNNTFLFVFSVFFIFGSSFAAYAIEPETFGEWFNSLWYVMTTVATVGYGDFSPKTVAGKLFAMFLYVFGIGILSLIIGKVIESFGVLKKRRESGKLRFHGKHHVIILNWSKKAQFAIEEIMSTDPGMEIVIIDQLDTQPYEHTHVHYVSGDPSADDTLAMANLSEARAAIVFADGRIDDPALADGKSLLIAASIERIAPQVNTTVEIVLEKNILNFRHVKVNDFILSHDAVSRLAARSAMARGNSQILMKLISSQDDNDLFEVQRRSDWHTYGDAFRGLLKEGATLIADRSDMSINRKLEERIPDEAKLFVICDKETIAQMTRRV